jgi:LPS export ABC transporter permease LptG/LPS export ABC transporter permease LptF
MRILSRAILREVAGAAILGTVLFTAVLFMQKLGSGKMFETLLRGSASPAVVFYLIAMLLPAAMVFALPTGTLVGVLIGLGRMSSDGEVIAMRAAGVPGGRVIPPILTLAVLGMFAAAACSLILMPWAIRETYRVLNKSVAQQLTAEIQPRVFEEQFTKSNVVLYVGDVRATASTTAEWKNVFLADVTPPDQRPQTNRQYSDAPRITVAAEALAVPDARRGTIQLSLRGVTTHEVDADPSVYHSTVEKRQEQLLQAKAREEMAAKPFDAMDTIPLWREAKTNIDARLELHRRLALPVACVVLAMVGIPLGVSSRRSGRSGAFVITVSLAFLYWMSLVSLMGMSRQGKLPAEVAAWTPNVVLGVVGILLLGGLERPGDRDLVSRARAVAGNIGAAVRSWFGRHESGGTGWRIGLPRIPLLPGVVDAWVLSTFLFYLAVLLGSFVLLAHVFIFFELLSYILSNKIAMSRVIEYHFYLTPMLLYTSAPMSILVAVLVTYGVMSKNNEVTAMKACGVSLYRLAMPVLIMSLLLSGALFAFDHSYIPDCNRRQDAILAEIKGRAPQTYLNPGRKWVYGKSSRIFYYKYLDPEQRVMAGPHVYELETGPFRLVRHVAAESARWEPSLNAWVFQNGWWKDVTTRKFETFQATTFAELAEPPSHFLQEVKQEKQLNFIELDNYIRELQQSGVDTVRLQVQFHKKFSVPMFGLVMALLATPFAFLAGNRGAMAGVGVSFGIAIAYWVVGRVFEEIGNVNQLPAAMAAWAPIVVFSLAGLYLFARMRT